MVASLVFVINAKCHNEWISMRFDLIISCKHQYRNSIIEPNTEVINSEMWKYFQFSSFGVDWITLNYITNTLNSLNWKTSKRFMYIYLLLLALMNCLNLDNLFDCFERRSLRLLMSNDNCFCYRRWQTNWISTTSNHKFTLICCQIRMLHSLEINFCLFIHFVN